MDHEEVAKIEHHKDETTGQWAVDENGTVVKRFASLTDAQDFVNQQPDPDRFAIQQGESTAFDIKQTALELAESGEQEAELAAEREFEEEKHFPL